MLLWHCLLKRLKNKRWPRKSVQLKKQELEKTKNWPFSLAQERESTTLKQMTIQFTKTGPYTISSILNNITMTLFKTWQSKAKSRETMERSSEYMKTTKKKWYSAIKWEERRSLTVTLLFTSTTEILSKPSQTKKWSITSQRPRPLKPPLQRACRSLSLQTSKLKSTIQMAQSR